MSVVEKALLDAELGRSWKARDWLQGALHRADDEVLSAVADVHLQMQDLPRAGALLFAVHGDEGLSERHRAAVEAWYERHHRVPGRLWDRLPP